jgi:hypothetical protein
LDWCLSAWAVELVKAGFYVETLPYNSRISFGDASNPQDLSNYDMFVVCEPNFPFTDQEKTAIINFVYKGGALFMIADHANSDRDGDGWDSPEIWNDLMNNNSVKNNPFGITFDYNDIDDDTYKIINDASDPIIFGSYGQVQNVEFYSGTTLTLDPDANPEVKGIVYQSTVSEVGGNSRVLVAYSFYGKGFVFAIGDSSPIDDGTGDVNDKLYDGWLEDANGNHRIMLMNASIFALSREIANVQDYPDKFKISVHTNFISINAPSKATVQVFDLTGREILHRNFVQSTSFVISEPGIYIIKVFDGNNFSVRKIAVNI